MREQGHRKISASRAELVLRRIDKAVVRLGIDLDTSTRARLRTEKAADLQHACGIVMSAIGAQGVEEAVQVIGGATKQRRMRVSLGSMRQHVANGDYKTLGDLVADLKTVIKANHAPGPMAIPTVHALASLGAVATLIFERYNERKGGGEGCRSCCRKGEFP